MADDRPGKAECENQFIYLPEMGKNQTGPMKMIPFFFFFLTNVTPLTFAEGRFKSCYTITVCMHFYKEWHR